MVHYVTHVHNKLHEFLLSSLTVTVLQSYSCVETSDSRRSVNKYFVHVMLVFCFPDGVVMHIAHRHTHGETPVRRHPFTTLRIRACCCSCCDYYY